MQEEGEYPSMQEEDECPGMRQLEWALVLECPGPGALSDASALEISRE